MVGPLVETEPSLKLRMVAIPPDPAGHSDLIRLDKVGAKRRNDKIDRVPDDRLFFSHGVSFHRYFMSIMKKPVTDCVGDRWFAKNFIPLLKG